MSERMTDERLRMLATGGMTQTVFFEAQRARASEDAKDKEIERLKADNAAPVSVLRDAVMALNHTCDTLNDMDAVDPEEDAEAMATVARVTTAMERIDSSPSPGTALLEELTRLRAQVATLIAGQQRNGEARQRARLDMAHELAEMDPAARDAAIRRIIDSHGDKP